MSYTPVLILIIEGGVGGGGAGEGRTVLSYGQIFS